MPLIGAPPGENLSATSTLNFGIGAVSLPALAAGAEGTVTINDARITPNSVVLCQLVNMNASGVADATALASVTCDIKGQPTTGQAVFHYKAIVAMAQVWTVWYLVLE